MRQDTNMQLIRMIPAPRHATANGAGSSAQTYGSASTTKGIVDTAGWDVAVVEVRKSSGTAGKASWRIAEQSARSTLFTSATNLASAVQCGITASAVCYRYVIDLRNSARKRFLNAKVITSTTSGMQDISCYLMRGETFPGANTGFTSVTVIP